MRSVKLRLGGVVWTIHLISMRCILTAYDGFYCKPIVEGVGSWQCWSAFRVPRAGVDWPFGCYFMRAMTRRYLWCLKCSTCKYKRYGPQHRKLFILFIRTIFKLFLHRRLLKISYPVRLFIPQFSHAMSITSTAADKTWKDPRLLNESDYVTFSISSNRDTFHYEWWKILACLGIEGYFYRAGPLHWCHCHCLV